MKTRDILLNTGIVVLILAAIVVVVFKFVLKPTPQHESFRFNNIEEVTVKDMAGNNIKLVDILEDNKETFVMIFELRNCGSCLMDGIASMKNFQQSGIPAKLVAVHDSVVDIVGFSSAENFSPIYVMSRNTFYTQIKCAILPVIVKIKNREAISYRYILK